MRIFRSTFMYCISFKSLFGREINHRAADFQYFSFHFLRSVLKLCARKVIRFGWSAGRSVRVCECDWIDEQMNAHNCTLLHTKWKIFYEFIFGKCVFYHCFCSSSSILTIFSVLDFSSLSLSQFYHKTKPNQIKLNQWQSGMLNNDNAFGHATINHFSSIYLIWSDPIRSRPGRIGSDSKSDEQKL